MPIQLLTIVSILLLASPPKEDRVKKEMDQLQGGWKSEVTVVDGAKRWTSLQFDGDAVTWQNHIAQGRFNKASVVKFTYKLDLSEKPPKIDLTWAEFANKGKVDLGIYRLEGDKLTLCTSQIGKERPQAFEAKEGSGHTLLHLERAKP